jgi:hypothetical protein
MNKEQVKNNKIILKTKIHRKKHEIIFKSSWLQNNLEIRINLEKIYYFVNRFH